MNLMSRGVPVLASVNPRSEIARIVRESGAGWVVDAADPDGFPSAIRDILADRDRASSGEAPPDWSSPAETSARRQSPRRFEEVLYETSCGPTGRLGATGGWPQ